MPPTDTKPTSDPKFVFEVTIRKLEQGAAGGHDLLQDSVTVSSRNLSLDEVIAMRSEMLPILEGFNKKDAA